MQEKEQKKPETKSVVDQNIYCTVTTYKEKQSFKKDYYSTSLIKGTDRMLEVFADCKDPKEDPIHLGINREGKFIYSTKENPEGKIVSLRTIRELFARIKKQREGVLIKQP